MIVGDNIYHYDEPSNRWLQADSHHSNADGTQNIHNVRNDTKAVRVLLSTHFFYFGRSAPAIPPDLLESLGFRNGRNYRVYDELKCANILDWLHMRFGRELNVVIADPFDFDNSSRRYSAKDNKIK